MTDYDAIPALAELREWVSGLRHPEDADVLGSHAETYGEEVADQAAVWALRWAAGLLRMKYGATNRAASDLIRWADRFDAGEEVR